MRLMYICNFLTHDVLRLECTVLVVSWSLFQSFEVDPSSTTSILSLSSNHESPMLVGPFHG